MNKLTKTELRALIKTCRGNRAKMQAEAKLSAGCVRRMMEIYDLQTYADDLAHRNKVTGPRKWLSPDVVAADRRRVVAAMSKHAPREAAKALGISLPTLYRRRDAYKITKKEIGG